VIEGGGSCGPPIQAEWCTPICPAGRPRARHLSSRRCAGVPPPPSASISGAGDAAPRGRLPASRRRGRPSRRSMAAWAARRGLDFFDQSAYSGFYPRRCSPPLFQGHVGRVPEPADGRGPRTARPRPSARRQRDTTSRPGPSALHCAPSRRGVLRCGRRHDPASTGRSGLACRSVRRVHGAPQRRSTPSRSCRGDAAAGISWGTRRSGRPRRAAVIVQTAQVAIGEAVCPGYAAQVGPRVGPAVPPRGGRSRPRNHPHRGLAHRRPVVEYVAFLLRRRPARASGVGGRSRSRASGSPCPKIPHHVPPSTSWSSNGHRARQRRSDP